FAVALVQRTRPADDAAPDHAREVDVPEVALRDPHPDHALAVALRRTLVEVTRAARIAVAVLVPLALDLPIRHRVSLDRPRFEGTVRPVRRLFKPSGRCRLRG